jgi:hypothetical protein
MPAGLVAKPKKRPPIGSGPEDSPSKEAPATSQEIAITYRDSPKSLKNEAAFHEGEDGLACSRLLS